MDKRWYSTVDILYTFNTSILIYKMIAFVCLFGINSETTYSIVVQFFFKFKEDITEKVLGINLVR